MIQIKHGSVFLLFLIVFTSCTEKIDIDLKNGDNNRLVVEGRITNQPGPHLVALSISTEYFYNTSTPRAKGAVVEISDGTSLITLTEDADGDYYTPSTFAGEVGKTYTLSITYNNELYTAVCELAAVSAVDSVGQEQDEDDQGNYFPTLFAQETPGEGNYYLWETYVNGIYRTAKLADKEWASDELVDGNYIDGFRFESVGLGLTDTVVLQMWSIPKFVYEYFDAVMLETEWAGSPFDGPPANVPTNISNGALGIFYASAVSEGSRVIR